jgi:hypothetical protein
MKKSTQKAKAVSPLIKKRIAAVPCVLRITLQVLILYNSSILEQVLNHEYCQTCKCVLTREERGTLARFCVAIRSIGRSRCSGSGVAGRILLVFFAKSALHISN